MNLRYWILFTGALLASADSLFGQQDATGRQDVTGQPAFPGGISLRYGWSSYAVRDRYISPERYEGMLPYYALEWSRSHDRYVYALDFAYSQADDIMNYNVSTNIIRFRLSQGFLYPVKPFTVFSRDLGFWLGPSTDVFYYENNPDIAVSGFDYTNSYSSLFSLGFRGTGICQLMDALKLESTLQFTVLSVGTRTVDSEEEEEPGTKPLTLASGLNLSYDLGVRYDLLGWLSAGFLYRFELTRVTAWEDILSAGNGGVCAVYFRF